MKLMSTGKDPLGVDPRTKGTPKPTSDGSSNDNTPQFDGVLSDVGSDAKATASADGALKAKATSVAAASTDASGPGNTIIGALINILGKGAGTTPTSGATDVKADAATAKSDPGAEGDDAVDSLLKKMAAKDSDSADTQTSTATAAVPPGTPADMMSMLLLGAKIQQAPQVVQASQVAQAATAVGTLDPRAKAPMGEPPASTDANEMIVSDIAVATHLAPAQTGPNKALMASGSAAVPADDASTALPGDAKPAPSVGVGGKAPETANLTAPAASPAHAHADDPETSGHTIEAPVSATTMTPAAMGASLAPIRSIAAAIGELAAPPSAAAAAPEAAKAPIGIARTMTLQMNPADLGTVDIRLHVTGQTLDVQLTISDSQTLGIVNRDRDALTSALHDQNYALNSLVIQDGGAAAPSGGNNGAQGDTSGSNARADRQAGNGTSSDTQSGGRQGSGANRSAQDERRQSRETAPRAPVAAESRAGTLYV